MLTFTIPAPCQAISANQRVHWAKRARWTKAWRARSYVTAIQAGRPKLMRAHVTATISSTSNRKRDVANLYPTVKAAIDGLVGDAGVLPGDDDAYLVGPDLRPGDKADVFTLTLTFDDACGCAACRERFGIRCSICGDDAEPAECPDRHGWEDHGTCCVGACAACQHRMETA